MSPWELALRLVQAEIEDAMDPDGQSVSPVFDTAVIAVKDSPDPGDVAVEIGALCAEAILRLAALRLEEPRDVLRWITDTAWSNAPAETA